MIGKRIERTFPLSTKALKAFYNDENKEIIFPSEVVAIFHYRAQHELNIKSYDLGFTTRSLYDFFDHMKISVGVIPLYSTDSFGTSLVGYGHSINGGDQWRLTGGRDTRIEAEEWAFNRAFEILEDKLSKSNSKIMEKYVIYKSRTCQIVKLTNETPDFKKMNDDEDFDTTANWMSLPDSKKQIEDHISNSK